MRLARPPPLNRLSPEIWGPPCTAARPPRTRDMSPDVGHGPHFFRFALVSHGPYVAASGRVSRRITPTNSTLPLRSRRSIPGATGIACACLVATWACSTRGNESAVGHAPQTGPRVPKGRIIALPPSRTSPSKRAHQGPYHFEGQASLIFVGRVGKAFEQDGLDLVRLHVERTLLGRLGTAALTAGDRLPSFGCPQPAEPRRASEAYREGMRVLVYLAGSAASGWRMLRVFEPKPERIEKALGYGLGVAALAAPHPAKTLEVLLADGINPHAAAALRASPVAPPAEPLMKRLRYVVQQSRALGNLDYEHAHEIVLLSLLLARAGAHDAIDPIVEALGRIDGWTPIDLYDALYTLAPTASPERRDAIRATMIRTLEKKGAVSRRQTSAEYRIRVLARVAEADDLDRIADEQRRHPRVKTIDALEQRYQEANDALEKQIAECLTDMLRLPPPKERFGGSQDNVLLHLLAVLRRIGTSDAELRRIRDRQLNAWVREPIDRFLASSAAP